MDYVLFNFKEIWLTKNKFNVFLKEIKTLINTGFFHIIFSQTLNKIIIFSNNLLLIRIISKTDFGTYSYAFNIISIFLLFSGLGANVGLLQFGSENKDNPQKLDAYSRNSWFLGISSSILLQLLILLYPVIFKIKVEGVPSLLTLMSFIPLLNFVQSNLSMGFRVRLQNKIFSILTTVHSLFILFNTVLGAYFFGIFGVVIFQYIGHLLSILISIFFVIKNNHFTDIEKTKLTKEEKKAFFSFSFVSSLNNAISQLLYLLDIFIIGIIIPNAITIAAYKTATTIPFALNFIPIAIMIYIFPYFASQNNNIKWIRNRYKQLIKVLLLFNGGISFVLVFLAPWIIRIFFGMNYSDSIIPFQILSIGFFLASTFRIPSGNILFSLREVRFNLFNSLFSGVINIILSVLLISRFGSIGAAFSSLTTIIISSILSTAYLWKKIEIWNCKQS